MVESAKARSRYPRSAPWTCGLTGRALLCESGEQLVYFHRTLETTARAARLEFKNVCLLVAPVLRVVYPLHRREKGFLNTTLEVDDASLAIEEAFPACKVLPASKLQLNQTGIDNGDITYLTASFTVGGRGRGAAGCKQVVPDGRDGWGRRRCWSVRLGHRAEGRVRGCTCGARSCFFRDWLAARQLGFDASPPSTS